MERFFLLKNGLFTWCIRCIGGFRKFYEKYFLDKSTLPDSEFLRLQDYIYQAVNFIFVINHLNNQSHVIEDFFLDIPDRNNQIKILIKSQFKRASWKIGQ